MRSAAGSSTRGRVRRRHLRSQRNGNTIIMVVGILVLLVIIATAYVTRTHAGRVTASASQRATLRDDNARVIGDMLAQEIALALFVFPIDTFNDPNDLSIVAADSNTARLSPLRNPVRYGIDQDNDGPDGFFSSGDDDGFPDFAYNFAPYHVAAWTNWPDGNVDQFWPGGDGNPGGGGTYDFNLPAFGADNPIGNPGFGDTRWLADLEPMRFILADGTIVFTHWRHMSNIARPNNGWRIVFDIANIEASLATELSIPVEQWTGAIPGNFDPNFGNTPIDNNFWSRWNSWFDSQDTYKLAYTLPALTPPNFYKLNDLDQNGAPDWVQERPEAEFVLDTPITPSARNRISRALADTDGDGYTDAFWFLAPTTNESGIRQVVAVRIIDNSAMANANVMTRAHVFDPLGVTNASTTGATPSDGALVGHPIPGQTELHVGFLDNSEHHDLSGNWYGNTWQAFNTDMWRVFETDGRGLNILQQLGIQFENGDVHSSFDQVEPLATAADRHRYWLWSGSRPFDSIAGLTPFTLADEIELRMFYGSNYPWILSRFERATQSDVRFEGSAEIFRANPQRQESNEYMNQLQNWELVLDMRHRLTMYSGARNDLMPGWLWFNLFPFDFNGIGGIDVDEFRQFEADRRKFDLRRMDVLDENGAFLNRDVDSDGVVEDPMFAEGPTAHDDDLDGDGDIDNIDLYYRLAQYIERALIDRGDPLDLLVSPGAYVDNESDDNDPDHNDLEDTTKLAYSLAANIMSWRDEDQEPLVPSMGLQPVDIDGVPIDARYIGFERQPFLVEAVIAHVNEGQLADLNHTNPFGDDIVGKFDNVICSNPASSTVVVVQIANPFDKELDLTPFELHVFGDSHNLTGALAAGASRVYYSIEGDLEENELQDEWFDLLSIDGLVEGDTLERVNGIWADDRSEYDNADEEEAVEIHRNFAALGESVLVDRIDIAWPNDIDDFEFGVAVTEFDAELPPDDCDEPGDGTPWSVMNIHQDPYWIQWAHAARAWEGDVNGTLLTIEANERNPRYVFAFREVSSEPDELSDDLVPDTIADADFSDTPAGRDNDVEINGNMEFEASVLNFSMQMLVKDRDFEQVGEVLNVFMWGHELDGTGTTTRTTFSEFMADEVQVIPGAAGDFVAARDKALVNRLRLAPADLTDNRMLGPVIGNGDDVNNLDGLLDLRHFEPALPAGARLLDAFVCDGRGARPNDIDRPVNNAIAFTGTITPGLINVNTAPLEVLRAMPHWTRLVHAINPADLDNPWPWMRIAEAMVRYRESIGDHDDLLDADLLPGYADRGKDTFIDNLRGTRGIAAIGELALITRSGAFNDPFLDDVYRMDYAGLGPFGDDVDGNGVIDPNEVDSSRISLDVNEPRNNLNIETPDDVAMDAEERNMLLAGASNMISTRSDVFTVYFKVRSFRQTPVGPNGFPVWDATNLEQIVDDSRYVMLVDRSEVNHPNDKPKILYFEKLPR